MALYQTGVALGAGKASLSIGYKLVGINGLTSADATTGFTTTGVVATSVPGNYYVAGGIALPPYFIGRIVWGEALDGGAGVAKPYIEDFGMFPDDIATAILDLINGVETGETLRQNLRLKRAIEAGNITYTPASGGTPASAACLRKDGTTTAITFNLSSTGARTVGSIGSL